VYDPIRVLRALESRKPESDLFGVPKNKKMFLGKRNSTHGAPSPPKKRPHTGLAPRGPSFLQLPKNSGS
jgi:hypothetical protein